MIEKPLDITTTAGEMETFIGHLPSRAQRTVSRHLIPGDGRHGIREELGAYGYGAPPPAAKLFSAMNVCDDEGDRRWPGVFNPMRSRPKFSKYLTGPKLLRGPVIMVIGENPGEDVDDRRVAPVTVEPNMAAWRHGRATDPQLSVFYAVYFLGQIDGGEHRFFHPFIVRRRRMLTERQASNKESQPG
jgi:hypothetical protein